MLLEFEFAESARFGLLQPRVPAGGAFVGFDAGGTEHHDGVPDTFLLQLRERVNVFGEDTDRPGRSALHEGPVFVRRLRRVLGLGAFTVGHERSPGEASYDCRQCPRFRQRLWPWMRRKKYAGKV